MNFEEKPSRPRRRQRVNIPQEDTEDNSWEGAPVTNVLKMATDNGDHSAVTEKVLDAVIYLSTDSTALLELAV